MILEVSNIKYVMFTTSTYGTWLPGEAKGYVKQGEQDVVGTPYSYDKPWLKRSAEKNLKCPPLLLTAEQADVLAQQFHETAEHERAEMYSFAIMPNHVHIFFSFDERSGEEGNSICGKFKSYGSRRLNKYYGKPLSGTWWTSSFSMRYRPVEAVGAEIRYIRQQKGALIVWGNPLYAE